MLSESVLPNISASSLQTGIEARGLEIFTRMAGEKPRVFTPGNVTGRLMDWSMRNESLKLQLFRFVDVLPSLDSPREVANHAVDYLGRDELWLPWWVERGIRG